MTANLVYEGLKTIYPRREEVGFEQAREWGKLTNLGRVVFPFNFLHSKQEDCCVWMAWYPQGT